MVVQLDLRVAYAKEEIRPAFGFRQRSGRGGDSTERGKAADFTKWAEGSGGPLGHDPTRGENRRGKKKRGGGRCSISHGWEKKVTDKLLSDKKGGGGQQKGTEGILPSLCQRRRNGGGE